jgi:hypothetical protein
MPTECQRRHFVSLKDPLLQQRITRPEFAGDEETE